MNLHPLAPISAALFLTACGGGGTGSVSLDQLVTKGQSVSKTLDGSDGDGADLTPDSALQRTGSARFSGVALAVHLADENSSDLDFAALGATRLTVDFGAGSVAGSADNFFELDDNELKDFENATGTTIAGRVDYTLGLAADEDNFYVGSATGSLTKVDGGVIRMNGEAAGGMLGAEGDAFIVEAFDETTNFGLVALTERD